MEVLTVLSSIALRRVPGEAEVSRLVMEYCSLHSIPRDPLPNARDLVDMLGWRYQYKLLGRESSGLRAVLVPLRVGGFSVIVNAHYQPEEAERIWLVAHEIAHSLFYRDSAPPRRSAPPTEREERFCDAFANCLVGNVAPSSSLVQNKQEDYAAV